MGNLPRIVVLTAVCKKKKNHEILFYAPIKLGCLTDFPPEVATADKPVVSEPRRT